MWKSRRWSGWTGSTTDASTSIVAMCLPLNSRRSTTVNTELRELRSSQISKSPDSPVRFRLGFGELVQRRGQWPGLTPAGEVGCGHSACGRGSGAGCSGVWGYIPRRHLWRSDPIWRTVGALPCHLLLTSTSTEMPVMRPQPCPIPVWRAAWESMRMSAPSHRPSVTTRHAPLLRARATTARARIGGTAAPARPRTTRSIPSGKIAATSLGVQRCVSCLGYGRCSSRAFAANLADCNTCRAGEKIATSPEQRPAPFVEPVHCERTTHLRPDRGELGNKSNTISGQAISRAGSDSVRHWCHTLLVWSDAAVEPQGFRPPQIVQLSLFGKRPHAVRTPRPTLTAQFR